MNKFDEYFQKQSEVSFKDNLINTKRIRTEYPTNNNNEIIFSTRKQSQQIKRIDKFQQSPLKSNQHSRQMSTDTVYHKFNSTHKKLKNSQTPKKRRISLEHYSQIGVLSQNSNTKANIKQSYEIVKKNDKDILLSQTSNDKSKTKNQLYVQEKENYKNKSQKTLTDLLNQINSLSNDNQYLKKNLITQISGQDNLKQILNSRDNQIQNLKELVYKFDNIIHKKKQSQDSEQLINQIAQLKNQVNILKNSNSSNQQQNHIIEAYEQEKKNLLMQIQSLKQQLTQKDQQILQFQNGSNGEELVNRCKAYEILLKTKNQQIFQLQKGLQQSEIEQNSILLLSNNQQFCSKVEKDKDFIIMQLEETLQQNNKKMKNLIEQVNTKNSQLAQLKDQQNNILLKKQQQINENESKLNQSNFEQSVQLSNVQKENQNYISLFHHLQSQFKQIEIDCQFNFKNDQHQDLKTNLENTQMNNNSKMIQQIQILIQRYQEQKSNNQLLQEENQKLNMLQTQNNQKIEALKQSQYQNEQLLIKEQQNLTIKQLKEELQIIKQNDETIVQIQANKQNEILKIKNDYEDMFKDFQNEQQNILKQKNIEIGILHKQINDLQSGLKNYEQFKQTDIQIQKHKQNLENHQLKSQILVLKQELEQQKISYDELFKQNKQLSQDFQNKLQEFQSQQQHEQYQIKSLDQKNYQLSDKDNDLNQFKRKIRSLQNSIKNSNLKIENQEDFISQLNQQILNITLDKNYIGKQYNEKRMEIESELLIVRKNLLSINQDYEYLQNDYQQSVQKYEEQIKILTSKIQDNIGIENTLRTQFEFESSVTIQNLQKQIKFQQNETSKLMKIKLSNQKQIEIKIQLLEDQEKMMNEYKNDIESLKLKLKSSNQQYKEIRNISIEYEEEIENQKNIIQNIEKEKKSLKGRLCSIDNYYKDMIQNYEEFQQKSEKKYYEFKTQNENEKFSLKTEIKNYQSKVNSLKIQISNLHELNITQNEKITNLIEQIDELKNKDIKQLNFIKELQNEVESLNITKMNSESLFTADIQKMRMNYEAIIKKLNQQNISNEKDYEYEKNDLEENIYDYKLEYQKVRKINKQLKENLQSIEDSSLKEIENLKNQINSLQQKLSVDNRNLTQMEKELIEMKKFYDKKIFEQKKHYENQINILNIQIDEINSDLNKFKTKTEIFAEKKIFDQLQKSEIQSQNVEQAEKYDDKMKAMILQLSNKDKIIQNLSANKQTLSIKVKDLENQLTQLHSSLKQNQNLMNNFRKDFKNNIEECEILKNKHDQKENHVLKYKLICDEAQEKNHKLVDDNQALLLRIFQLRLLIEFISQSKTQTVFSQFNDQPVEKFNSFAKDDKKKQYVSYSANDAVPKKFVNKKSLNNKSVFLTSIDEKQKQQILFTQFQYLNYLINYFLVFKFCVFENQYIGLNFLIFFDQYSFKNICWFQFYVFDFYQQDEQIGLQSICQFEFLFNYFIGVQSRQCKGYNLFRFQQVFDNFLQIF